MTLVLSSDIIFMPGNIFLNSGRSQSGWSLGPSLLCKNYHILVITFIVGISRSEINSILNPVWQFWATEIEWGPCMQNKCWINQRRECLSWAEMSGRAGDKGDLKKSIKAPPVPLLLRPCWITATSRDWGTMGGFYMLRPPEMGGGGVRGRAYLKIKLNGFILVLSFFTYC